MTVNKNRPECFLIINIMKQHEVHYWIKKFYGDEKMALWLRVLALPAEDLGLVTCDLMPSSGLCCFQACVWYTDVNVGKTLMHIK